MHVLRRRRVHDRVVLVLKDRVCAAKNCRLSVKVVSQSSIPIEVGVNLLNATRDSRTEVLSATVKKKIKESDLDGI